MDEAGQREFGGARGSAGDGRRLPHLHRKTGTCHDNGGSQAIGTRSDNGDNSGHNKKPLLRVENLKQYDNLADRNDRNFCAGWKSHHSPAWIWRHAYHPGPGIWGEPKDRGEALRVLRRAVELGVNFIDTADSVYRP